jgi:hypothetical protein
MDLVDRRQSRFSSDSAGMDEKGLMSGCSPNFIFDLTLTLMIVLLCCQDE